MNINKPKSIILSFPLSILLFTTGCSRGSASDSDAWTICKSSQLPLLALTSEFAAPQSLSISTLGWEDGIAISRDGLDLYCTYVPGDMLSYSLSAYKNDPGAFGPFLRGPLYGIDLVTNPAGKTSWVHGEILYSHRTSISKKFPDWTRAGVSQAVYSEGAAQQYNKSGSSLEAFVYTSNEKPVSYYGQTQHDSGPWDTDIWVVLNTTLKTSGIIGTPGTSGVRSPHPTFPRTTYTEDNPHAELVAANTIVLMFDSDNYNGVTSNGLDIWYSVSTDNGGTWTTPSAVTSVNTAQQENQPHLFKNALNEWYLYYSATHSDGKLAIFRRKQLTANNWNSWGTKELVISAGSTGGVGEPTLTANGDISFVVVYDKGTSEPENRFDADPWFMKKK